MKLSDIEFIKLLPYFMRDDLANIALSKSIDDFVKVYADRIPCLSEHLSFENMTEEELAEIAWERNIPWWNSAYTLEQKIELIRAEKLIKERKGTVWSILKIIEITIGDAIVGEWYEYGGDPASFIIYTSVEEMDDDLYNLMVDLINETKPARSHLDGIYFYMDINAAINVSENLNTYNWDYKQCGTIPVVATIGYSIDSSMTVDEELTAYKYSYNQASESTETGTANGVVSTIGYSIVSSAAVEDTAETYTYTYYTSGTLEAGEVM